MSKSLATNLFRVLSAGSDQAEIDLPGLASWIMWRLWKNRNELVFKGLDYPAIDSIHKAREDAEEWVSSKVSNTSTHSPKSMEITTQVWKKPTCEWLKCNVDGAWNPDRNDSGIGWVLRDSVGDVRWIGAMAIPKTRTVLETEAEALRWAILRVSSLGYTRELFESDYKMLVTAIITKESQSCLAPIIQDIIKLLSCIPNAQVVYHSREGNKVVDRIARQSLSFGNYVPRFYSTVPLWVKNFVDHEKSM